MKAFRYLCARLLERPTLLLAGLIVVALFTAFGRAAAQRSPRLERLPPADPLLFDRARAEHERSVSQRCLRYPLRHVPGCARWWGTYSWQSPTLTAPGAVRSPRSPGLPALLHGDQRDIPHSERHFAGDLLQELGRSVRSDRDVHDPTSGPSLPSRSSSTAASIRPPSRQAARTA